jgi:hypothetical protein
MLRLFMNISIITLVLACFGATSHSAGVGSNPPGIDKADSPEVKELIRKVWSRIDKSPKTAYIQLKGTSLGHEMTEETWLGDGNIVAKSTIESTGVVTVLGDIDNTTFKTVNGKPATMTLKERVKQTIAAHPRETMRLLFETATRITHGHGHMFHEKTTDLILHGLPHGNVILQFYEDGTIATMASDLGHGIMHATVFGDYKEFQGHKVPGRIVQWVVSPRPGGGWSTTDPGSHRLSLMALVTAKVNEPIPPRIFKLSTWEPEKESKPGT